MATSALTIVISAERKPGKRVIVLTRTIHFLIT